MTEESVSILFHRPRMAGFCPYLKSPEPRPGPVFYSLSPLCACVGGGEGGPSPAL